MKQIIATVISNREVLPGFARPHARTILSSQLIWLKCPEVVQEARPGQFIMVRCGVECLLPRPFSIHRVNDEGIALFFYVWEGGKGTNWLSRCRAGEKVELFGPLGNGFSILPDSKNLLLMAGGVGIAPLYFLAQEALRRGYSVKLLLGAQTAPQLYPEHLLPPEIKLAKATNDGTVGKKGLVTDLLTDFIDWAEQVFACGPVLMYRDMALKRQELKLAGKPVQVSLEARMGCGRGICYGCTVKTKGGLKQVCRDGPIFDLQDVLEDELSPI